jgi:hypothetical protein
LTLNSFSFLDDLRYDLHEYRRFLPEGMRPGHRVGDGFGPGNGCVVLDDVGNGNGTGFPGFVGGAVDVIIDAVDILRREACGARCPESPGLLYETDIRFSTRSSPIKVLAVTLPAEVLPFTAVTCMAATPRIPMAKMTMAISTSIKGEATLIRLFSV